MAGEGLSGVEGMLTRGIGGNTDSTRMNICNRSRNFTLTIMPRVKEKEEIDSLLPVRVMNEAIPLRHTRT